MHYKEDTINLKCKIKVNEEAIKCCKVQIYWYFYDVPCVALSNNALKCHLFRTLALIYSMKF